MMGSSSTWSPRILRLSYQLASVYGFIDSFNWILDPLLETIIPSQTVWSCSCSHIPRKKKLTDWDPSACSLWCHGEEMSGGTVPVLCIQRAERPSSGMPWIRVAPRSFFGVAKSCYKTMCLWGARGYLFGPNQWLGHLKPSFFGGLSDSKRRGFPWWYNWYNLLKPRFAALCRMICWMLTVCHHSIPAVLLKKGWDMLHNNVPLSKSFFFKL